MKKLLLAAVLFSALTTSCKKNKTEEPSIVYAEEDYFGGYLIATGFEQKTDLVINSPITAEMGVEFAPKVKGKITALKIKLPAVDNALRVTLWDKATKAVIKTEIVNVNNSSTTTIFDIADIDLIKDKEYFITMNTNDFYIRSRTNNTNATYPVTIGNIKVLSFQIEYGSAQIFPTFIVTKQYNGDLSFNFQQTQ